MIDRARLQALFTELAETDSPSRGERAVCDKIKEKLTLLGIKSHEDGTGNEIGGNAGNLYAYIEGEGSLCDLPPLLLSAHMDTVEPSCGKKAVVHEDGTITSDGTTVLGADDFAGVAAILEAVAVLKESGLPHRPVELLFDVSEETYCTGIQRFDFSRLRSKEAYVFDLSGPVGGAAYQAPTILSFRAAFRGRAAHAAFSPEDGIHAVKAAAEAIAAIPCGHVGDTTVNIGTVNGGIADNIVPEKCLVTGEVRSFCDDSAKKQLAEIERIFRLAAEKAHASLDFHAETLCAAYCTAQTEPVVQRFLNACGHVGLKSNLVSTYGGSDNNHFFHHGIRGIVVAPGMNNCHSCQEYTSVSELEKAAKLALTLITLENGC